MQPTDCIFNDKLQMAETQENHLFCLHILLQISAFFLSRTQRIPLLSVGTCDHVTLPPAQSGNLNCASHGQTPENKGLPLKPTDKDQCLFCFLLLIFFPSPCFASYKLLHRLLGNQAQSWDKATFSQHGGRAHQRISFFFIL